jgi:anti-anti-sigma factor
MSALPASSSSSRGVVSADGDGAGPGNRCEVTFATHWAGPSVRVIAATGEVDASNGRTFAEYPRSCLVDCKRLVLDLRGLEFFGTAGFGALHTVNVQCASVGADWVLVPGPVVSRLLRVCDPDSVLPAAETVQAALGTLHGARRRQLELVAQPRWPVGSGR